MEQQSSLPRDSSLIRPEKKSFWQRISPTNDLAFRNWAIMPVLLILILLTLQPALQLIAMSVSDVGFEGGALQWEYVGGKHIQEMLSDPVVPDAFRNTLVYVVVVVIVETAVGLVLALAVSRVTHLVGFYRAIYVVPILIPPIAIGTIWRLMYDYNYGIINQTSHVSWAFRANCGQRTPIWRWFR
jgi:multiple sugar transport system permease protein